MGGEGLSASLHGSGFTIYQVLLVTQVVGNPPFSLCFKGGSLGYLCFTFGGKGAGQEAAPGVREGEGARARAAPEAGEVPGAGAGGQAAAAHPLQVRAGSRGGGFRNRNRLTKRGRRSRGVPFFFFSFLGSERGGLYCLRRFSEKNNSGLFESWKHLKSGWTRISA